jgi:dTDP-4-dehydrorhamnose reductase
MKRILLIGKTGQIGAELAQLLPNQGEVLAIDRSQLDLFVAADIARLVRDWRPGIVINAAAYTAVDKAETDEENATKINAHAPGVLAEECKKLGALLVHYSTDYVFDGKKDTPYIESDPTSPINAYGRSKLAGEQAIRAAGVRHLILRTSWVYAIRGQNFLRTMLRLADEREEIRVVSDQQGTPNWARQLAQSTTQLIDREIEGLYHLNASGFTTWYGFADAIFEHTRLLRHKTPRLVPISSAEYPLPAARPKNSRLSGEALARDASVVLADWKSALVNCLNG